ncbi:uncharacterized protein LOC115447830 [Manduca sexta]|uniref:uncharacterized protein LOC115447830 n=1 Tax=Manduca sexta TaxID=7130 RepID=UPI0018904137|nr:uncharacterized protein LOC115447830 [Manduca sexta]
MAGFCLKDSDEYYLSLTEQPKRFDADSPVTSVFFDDTNGQVFSVRSGGIGGVTVNSMDESKCTSFQMEDKGAIISIKFSPDQKILAIQRNQDNQSATVEFVNFKDLTPTNVEYSHTCKWKNAKMLGFVWPRVNEIAFITDHGIELLQVLPEKKQLKSLKNTTFSGAWFSWCSQSNIVLLAGNNGVLLQPFSLNNSTVTKLQKLELDAAKPVVERDVFLLRLCDATWCAVFRHASLATVAAPGPTEVWLMPISGPTGFHYTHVLKTGLAGRFAVSVVDDLIIVHHQSSQTSQVFDIMEESAVEGGSVFHVPVVAGSSMRPAVVDDRPCPMYSGTWVVFQPDYIIDARLGCLWQVKLVLSGLAYSVPKDSIPKIVAVLLRRNNSDDTIYRILNQLVNDAAVYLLELSKIFDEINSVYRKWAEVEMARNTAGASAALVAGVRHRSRAMLSQEEVCARVLLPHTDHPLLVQVVTAFLASLWRQGLSVQQAAGALCVRALVLRGARGRLRALVRRGALGDHKPLACQLLSLGHLDRAAAQLALDMMWRLRACSVSITLVLRGARGRLRALVRRGALGDHKPLACQLLSLGHLDRAAAQLALDMMWRLRACSVSITLVLRGARGRLRALVRRGALGDHKPLACQLLSLGHLDRAAAQLALDMMWRLRACSVSITLVLRGARGRLRALVRRGALGDHKPLACQLLSLGHLDRAAAQLALDMMWRLRACSVSITLVLRGARGRLRALVRRGALGDHKPLACQLLSLGHLDRAAAQLALDMMWRLRACSVSITLVLRGARGRLRALVRRGALGDHKPLACQLLSLGHLDRAAAQLALDMMWRLRACSVSITLVLRGARGRLRALVRRGALGDHKPLACQLLSLGHLDRAAAQLALDMMWRLRACSVSITLVLRGARGRLRALVRRGALGDHKPLACQLLSLGHLDRAAAQLALDMMWRLRACSVSITLVLRGARGRLRALVRRGALGDHKPLACQLLSLGHLDRAAAQLALDMMWRLRACSVSITLVLRGARGRLRALVRRGALGDHKPLACQLLSLGHLDRAAAQLALDMMWRLRACSVSITLVLRGARGRLRALVRRGALGDHKPLACQLLSLGHLDRAAAQLALDMMWRLRACSVSITLVLRGARGRLRALVRRGALGDHKPLACQLLSLGHLDRAAAQLALDMMWRLRACSVSITLVLRGARGRLRALVRRGALGDHKPLACQLLSLGHLDRAAAQLALDMMWRLRACSVSITLVLRGARGRLRALVRRGALGDHKPLACQLLSLGHLDRAAAQLALDMMWRLRACSVSITLVLRGARGRLRALVRRGALGDHKPLACQLLSLGHLDRAAAQLALDMMWRLRACSVSITLVLRGARGRLRALVRRGALGDHKPLACQLLSLGHLDRAAAQLALDMMWRLRACSVSITLVLRGARGRLRALVRRGALGDHKPLACQLLSLGHLDRAAAQLALDMMWRLRACSVSITLVLRGARGRLRALVRRGALGDHKPLACQLLSLGHLDRAAAQLALDMMWRLRACSVSITLVLRGARGRLRALVRRGALGDHKPLACQLLSLGHLDRAAAQLALDMMWRLRACSVSITLVLRGARGRLRALVRRGALGDHKPLACQLLSLGHLDRAAAQLALDMMWRLRACSVSITLVLRGARGRLRALVRRGALGDHKPLACQLLSLGHLDRAAAQLALDMMWRLRACSVSITLVLRGARGRLRALVRRGALGDHKPLACQLLSLGHLDRAAAQLALDMMWRLRACSVSITLVLRGARGRLRALVRRGALGDHKPLACQLLSLGHLDRAAAQLALDMMWRLRACSVSITLVLRGARGRLRALVRRGALGDHKPLACQLLSLGHLDRAAAQLALDMMWRLRACSEVVEVLLSWDEPVSAVGAARQADAALWAALAPRKLLGAAQHYAAAARRPHAFLAVYHALLNRNDALRGATHFLKGEQCDSYVEYYKQLTSEQ